MSDFLAIISLGGNVGHPHNAITGALKTLKSHKAVTQLSASSFYETPPMGPKQPNFLNAVASFFYQASALHLLDTLQLIEKAYGRNRKNETRWGPRPLDLDILFFKNETHTTKKLLIPHPGLCDRAFVLTPLSELHPDFVLPNGQTALESAIQLHDPSIKKLPTKGALHANNPELPQITEAEQR